MKISVQLFGLAPDEYAPLTVRAEELGFETVWVADHVVTPLEYENAYPYSASGDPGYRPDTPLTDVAVTLGYLAARTHKIGLGSGVFVLPMRNPFHVARSFAALQNLSAGRAILGIGTGWMREEFDAVGADFASRGRRMEEMLDVLDLLWTGETVEFHGEHYSFDPVHFAGAPVRPVPLVFGGHGPVALRRAARRGSGWFGPNVELPVSLRYIDVIEAERRHLGRADPFIHYVRLFGEATPAAIRRYADSGMEHVVFAPFTRPGIEPTPAGRLQALEDAAAALGILPLTTP